MTINIPHEYRSLLNEAVASGAYASHEEALKHALTLLAAERLVEPERLPGSSEAQEWNSRFRDWAFSHSKLGHFVDASRDGIYEGRGL